MALESASYISDLVSSNPAGSDTLAQADDHIRLTKGVIKNTFPNINAQVTSTPLQLNTYLVPFGAILMWSGSVASIPSGWALCDGSTKSKADGTGSVVVPDLRGKFLVGAGGSYTVASTGGAVSSTPAITMTNAPVVLDVTQIPPHTHVATVTDAGHSHTLTDPGHTHTYVAGGSNTNAAGLYGSSGNPDSKTSGSTTTGITMASNVTGVTVSNSSAGGGLGHTHANTATCAAVPTLPPYYALCYIFKL